MRQHPTSRTVACTLCEQRHLSARAGCEGAVILRKQCWGVRSINHPRHSRALDNLGVTVTKRKTAICHSDTLAHALAWDLVVTQEYCDHGKQLRVLVRRPDTRLPSNRKLSVNYFWNGRSGNRRTSTPMSTPRRDQGPHVCRCSACFIVQPRSFRLAIE